MQCAAGPDVLDELAVAGDNVEDGIGLLHVFLE